MQSIMPFGVNKVQNVWMSANIFCNSLFERLTSNIFFYSDGFFFAVKEVSLMDQGLNAKQRILQLEHVSNGLFMLENDARYFASNDMFLN